MRSQMSVSHGTGKATRMKGNVILNKEQRRIVARIKNLHRHDEPLNISAVKRLHPDLMESAYKVRPFWGWKQALTASGIAYADIRVSLLDYVACEICGKEFARLNAHLNKVHGASADDYRIDYPDAETSCEELRARIMKRHRIHGARKSIQDWEQVWTKEYVLDKVWAHYTKGHPVNLRTVKLTDRSLYRASLRYFRSWDDLLRCLDLDPQRIRRHQASPYLEAKDIVRAIQHRSSNGQPLYHHALAKNKPVGDRLLLVTAKRFFGSWAKAVEAAGVSYKTVVSNRRYPTAQAVLKEIVRRNQLQLALNQTALDKQDVALYLTGVRYFGSWRAAIAAAGLDYERTRKDRKCPSWVEKYPDRSAIVRAIRSRRKAGLPLRRCDLMAGKDRNPGLVHAASHHIGRWREALRAAGVNDVGQARRRFK